MQNFNSIDLSITEILSFKFILKSNIQNVPCALGFEVKHKKKILVEVSGHL